MAGRPRPFPNSVPPPYWAHCVIRFRYSRRWLMVGGITRRLAAWPYLVMVMLAVALVCAPTAAFAQPVTRTDISLAPLPDCVPPGPGSAANFVIDGALICPGTAEDWFSLTTNCT